MIYEYYGFSPGAAYVLAVCVSLEPYDGKIFVDAETSVVVGGA